MSIRLLTEDEIWDTSIKAELPMLKADKKCQPTDFAVLLGGNFNKDDSNFTTMWWSSTYNQVFVTAVYHNEGMGISPMRARYMSIRPAMEFSELQKLFHTCKIVGENDKCFVCIAGEYPQTIVNLQNIDINLANYTGKFYTINGAKAGERAFEPQELPELEYNGNKFIKVTAHLYDRLNSSTVNLGDVLVVDGQDYFVKVEPIKWLVDKKTNIAVCQKALVAGIPMNKSKFNNFEQTDLFYYLNNYFSKEIVPAPSKVLIKISAPRINNQQVPTL